MSREPLLAVEFTRYRVGGPPERLDQGDFLGGKGFALARLGGRLRGLAVAITHLQASYGGEGYLAHRTAQAAELGLSLAEVPGPVVVAGDLNAEPESLPIALLRGLARLRDAAAEAGPPEPTTQALAPGSSRPERRIDYVLLRDGPDEAIRVAGFRRVLHDVERLPGGGALRPSDHAGLLADLELHPGSPEAAAPAPPPPLREAVDLLAGGARHDEGRRWAGIGAAGTAATATVAALAASRRRASRRDLLRWMAEALAAGGAGATLLAAGATAEIAAEGRAFRELAAKLARLEGSGSVPDPGSGVRRSPAGRGGPGPSAPEGSRR